MTKQQKPLGIWSCASLVVGNMVGSGIFLLPATLAAFGSISLGGWLISAVAAMVFAFMFANLSHLMPKMGGPYAYCRSGLGDFIGFKVAVCYWMASLLSVAATITTLTSYLSIFWPSLNRHHFFAFLISAGALWVIAIINIMGIRKMQFSQITTNALKLLPLIILAVVGIFHIDFDNFKPFNLTGSSSFSILSTTAILTLWAFIGLESATIPTEHVVNPKRTIARATLLGTSLTALIYIGVSFVVMGLLPNDVLAHNDAPIAAASAVIFGSWAIKVIAATAVLSCFSSVIGWVLVIGEIPLASAKDGLFPQIFGKLSKHGTPKVGLIISCAMITLMMALNYNAAFIDQFTALVEYSALMYVIPFLYTCVSALLIYSRHAQPRLAYAVAMVGFVFSLWMVLGSGKDTVFYGALFFFACSPIYFWVKHKSKSVEASA